MVPSIFCHKYSLSINVFFFHKSRKNQINREALFYPIRERCTGLEVIVVLPHVNFLLKIQLRFKLFFETKKKVS